MKASDYLVFCAIAILQVGSPGPSTVFVVNNALAQGWRRALLALTGDLLAIGILGLLALFGVDVVLQANPRLYTSIKVAGAVYLVWLGIQQWLARRASLQVGGAEAEDRRREPLTALWAKSFLVGISNPKAILFFSSLLPQFVRPAQGSDALLLLLVGLFLSIKLIVLGGYAVASEHLLGTGRLDSGARWGKRATGTLLIVFGGLIALSAIR
jgi:threonine/homoserine/homoserine lactone efflux protein